MPKSFKDKTIPKFKLKATGDKTISSEDFKGRNLIIYFYPKDSTPGCTLEGQVLGIIIKNSKSRY